MKFYGMGELFSIQHFEYYHYDAWNLTVLVKYLTTNILLRWFIDYYVSP